MPHENEAYVITGNCSVNTDLVVEEGWSLSLSSGTLVVYGNIGLMDNSFINIVNGGIKFPQLNYAQYSLNLQDTATFTMTDSSFVTIYSTENNFFMSLNAYGNATVIFHNSFLDTNTGSWLLVNFFEDSVLISTGSANLPTEVSPSDDSSCSMLGQSQFAGIWL